MKLNIIYFSTTGNTEGIAHYIGEGAASLGAEVEMISVDSADDSLLDVDYLAFGSSATGAEEVGAEMVEFIEDNIEKIKGKKVGLFGSYDWGGGEWMEYWIKDMEDKGVEVVGEGLRIQLAVDDDEKIEEARKYGVEIIK